MKCWYCSRAGYAMAQNESKQYWCGTCNATPNNIRTIGGNSGTPASNSGFTGYTGRGSVAGLPNMCSLQEWSEIANLCKRVSSPKVLTEDKPFKPLPLPHEKKNPLDEKPTDKRAGWTPFSEYLKNSSVENDSFSPTEIKKNLFDQKFLGKKNLFEG